MALTTESLEALLSWLDSDREVAGQKYLVIQAGLIRMFVSSGVDDGARWADETLDRVGKKVPEIRETYVGDKVRFIYGVARKVRYEALRSNKELSVDEIPEIVKPQPEPESDECIFLRECLALLSADKRDLILDYHLYKGSAKVENHQRMAESLSISKGALRTRAHHIRDTLEKGVRGRMQQLGGETNSSKNP